MYDAGQSFEIENVFVFNLEILLSNPRKVELMFFKIILLNFFSLFTCIKHKIKKYLILNFGKVYKPDRK
jgi:hypothetical protein